LNKSQETINSLTWNCLRILDQCVLEEAVGQTAVLHNWVQDFTIKKDAIVEGDLDECGVLADGRKDLGVDLGCGDGIIAFPLAPIA
jgi:hypothetical protein